VRNNIDSTTFVAPLGDKPTLLSPAPSYLNNRFHIEFNYGFKVRLDIAYFSEN